MRKIVISLRRCSSEVSLAWKEEGGHHSAGYIEPNTTYTFDFGDAIRIIMRGILGEFLLFFLYEPSRLYGCGRYSTECGQS